MANSELSVMLTAKGNLENELKSARDRVKDLSKEIRTIQASGGTVGDELAADFRKASIAAEKLGREVTETNRKIKTAASQSASAAAKIGRAWQKTAGIFSNNVVAGISAVGIALAGRQAINAYATAEKMQLNLNLAYQKFPAIADVSRQSWDQLNQALMNATGADDDALASAEGLLARFNLTGREIQALIPLVNDYAIATGRDIPTAAELIGKSLMGNARALKTLGIDFKATGDRGKDLANIMAALEGKVGGAGAAFRETTAGDLAVAQENFENLQEEIGGTLVPALQAVVGVVRPMAQWFSNLSDPVKTSGVVVAALGTAALIATPRIIALKAAMTQAGIAGGSLRKGMGNVIGFLGGPWGAALAVGGLALAKFAGDSADAEDRVRRLTDSIDVATGKLSAAGVATIAETLMKDISEDDWKTLDRLGFSVETVTSAIIGGEDAWATFGESVARARSELDPLDGDRGLLSIMKDNAAGLRSETESAADAFGIAGRAAKLAGVDVEDAGEDFADTGDEAATAATKVSALARAMTRLSRASSRQQALRAYRKSLREFVEKPSKDAAYEVVDNFNSAYSTFKEGSQRQASYVQDNYAEMKKTIENSGLSAANRAELLAPLNEALVAANRVKAGLATIDGTTVTANVNITTTGNAPFNPIRRAAGGPVWGPGTATSDSIPARLSNGEYVIRAGAVRALGLGTLNKLNRADKMSDPALLSKLAASRGEPTPVGAGGPLIGEIHVHNPAQGLDVEKAVVHGLARAERIKRERGV